MTEQNIPGTPEGFVRGTQQPSPSWPAPQGQPFAGSSPASTMPQPIAPLPDLTSSAPDADAASSAQGAVASEAIPTARRRRFGLGLAALVTTAALAIGGTGFALGQHVESTRSATTPAASGSTGQQPDVGSGGSSSGTSGSGAGASGTIAGTASGQQRATAEQSKGVVLITASSPSGSGAGTGMVIDASGLVLTNYHVVQGSTALKVTVASTGATYTGTVLGHDATRDVALVKLAGVSGALDTVTIDTDAVGSGDTVTAVGNAQGQGYLTQASGAITDTSATITVSTDSASGSETLTDVYQTNAAAQPGDSGGPLFDAQGQVTGITTAGEQTYRGPRQRSGASAAATVASYAIPIERALTIAQQIESGHDSGTVQVGANAYLGVLVVPSRSGLPVVNGVTAGSGAATAGIATGSVITAIGDTAVTSQADIADALATLDPGDTIRVSWTGTDGVDHHASVTLGSSPVN